jgi:hypothetical protein
MPFPVDDLLAGSGTSASRLHAAIAPLGGVT